MSVGVVLTRANKSLLPRIGFDHRFLVYQLNHMKLRVVLPLLFAALFLSSQAMPPMKWESLMLMKAAAEKGDPEAQFLYGTQVRVGDGITADPVEAAKWFRQAALSGHADAQAALGLLYSEPNGKMFDPVEAEIWLEMAAKQGNSEAITRLGILLSRGAGRDRSVPPEMNQPPVPPGEVKEEAVAGVITKNDAVTALPAGAPDKSGAMNEDPETTVRWSLLLSGLRGADAYVVRGYLLENGVGMVRDDLAAAGYYRQAALQGSTPGQFRLGQCYAEGRGVPRDLVEAHYWLRLAASRGSAEAGTAQAALLPRLDKEALAAAERLWQERFVLTTKK